MIIVEKDCDLREIKKHRFTERRHCDKPRDKRIRLNSSEQTPARNKM